MDSEVAEGREECTCRDVSGTSGESRSCSSADCGSGFTSRVRLRGSLLVVHDAPVDS